MISDDGQDQWEYHIAVLSIPDGPRAATADESKAERAYARLKHEILRCIRQPGERFTERTLMAELEVGKTPLREALTRLEAAGLIESLPRVGYKVSSITLADVRDTFGMRLIVEPVASELACGRVDIEVLRRLDRAAPREGTSDFLGRNRALHTLIARSSGNAKLAQSIEGLLDSTERILSFASALGRDVVVWHGHAELIAALASGEAGSARDAAASAIVDAQSKFLDTFLLRSGVDHVSLRAPSTRPESH